MDEIPALGTSTAAFIGWFPRAPAAAAVRVRGVREAAGAVGEDVRSVALTALGHFFACGGGRVARPAGVRWHAAAAGHAGLR